MSQHDSSVATGHLPNGRRRHGCVTLWIRLRCLRAGRSRYWAKIDIPSASRAEIPICRQRYRILRMPDGHVGISPGGANRLQPVRQTDGQQLRRDLQWIDRRRIPEPPLASSKASTTPSRLSSAAPMDTLAMNAQSSIARGFAGEFGLYLWMPTSLR